RRHLDARADAERIDRGSRRRHEPPRHRGRGERCVRGRGQRSAEGDPRLLVRRARIDRLQRQPVVVDRRYAVHESDGGRFRQGPLVVRQRVGLFEPLRGPAPQARQKRIVKLSIRDLDLKDQRVFIRVDFNVPLKAGRIGDDTRIRETMPTIAYAPERRGTVVVASHLGRPKGKPNPEMSLRPVANRLGEILGKPVVFATDCVGKEAENAVAGAHRAGGPKIVLLENLRFHAEEENNDPGFARALASLAERYVNDAFGAAHRAHASVEGITHFVKRPAAGLLMERELKYLGHALESPERPFIVILGGAKVSDKIDVIQNMLGRVDTLIIGGAMAYTFFKARGVPVGKSLVEDDKIHEARQIEETAAGKNVKLELPVDHVVAGRLEAGSANEVL